MAETALHFGYIVQTIINSIDMDNLEEGIDKLRAFIPDTTLVAALDAVDRDRVLRYKTTWGRCHYEVFGSTSTYYTVFPQLGFSAKVFCYCTCPAFAFAVLVSNSHLMVGRSLSPNIASGLITFQCKHVLAVCLAEQL